MKRGRGGEERRERWRTENKRGKVGLGKADLYA